jgi:hypothetical protein
MNPSYNGVKDRVDIYVDGEEGKADGSSNENDKNRGGTDKNVIF